MDNTQKLYSGISEQTIEQEYVLPDYCPDIFKILKSKVCTRVLSYRLEGKNLEIDGINIVTLLYLSEENNAVRQLEQRLVFTKNIELKEEFPNAFVKISASKSYLNCKVLSSRKLEIHGAVNLDYKLFGNIKKDIHCDYENLQKKEQNLEITAPMLNTYKSFSLKEELEVGAGKTPISDIISYEATARPLSYKILANKAICKGELCLHTLYVGSKEPTKPQWVEHTIPISRIIDFDNIDEDYTLDFYFDVTKYDIDLQVDEDGECRNFTAEVGLRICLEACKNTLTQIVDDCYSTQYDTNIKKETMDFERLESELSDTVMLTNQISFSDLVLDEISDINAEVVNISVSENVVNYSIKVGILAIDRDATPSIIEDVISGEYAIPLEESLLPACVRANVHIDVKSISYHMVNASVCEVKCELYLYGLMFSTFSTEVIVELEVLENEPKTVDDTPQIKVYFASENETLWDIAKRYNTTITELIDYNNLDDLSEGDILTHALKYRELVLIP